MSNYALEASYATVQVLSPTLVNDVVYCTIQTNPSNVVASLPVSQAAFNDNQAVSALTNFAEAIEQVMGIDYVIAGAGTQQIDENGLLADYVTFTIGYPHTAAVGSAITAQADVPVGLLDFSDAEIGRVLLQEVETITLRVYNNLKSAAGG